MTKDTVGENLLNALKNDNIPVIKGILENNPYTIHTKDGLGTIWSSVGKYSAEAEALINQAEAAIKADPADSNVTNVTFGKPNRKEHAGRT